MIRIWDDHANWVTCTPFYDPSTSFPLAFLSSSRRSVLTPLLSHSHSSPTALHRRRLLTVTFDGALDLWEFDPRDATVSSDCISLDPLNVADEVLDLQNSGERSEESESGELIMALTRAFALVGGVLFILRVARYEILRNNGSSSNFIDSSNYIPYQIIHPLPFFQIFIIRESRFVPQVKIPCPADSSWAGGVFASGSRLVLWSQVCAWQYGGRKGEREGEGKGGGKERKK